MKMEKQKEYLNTYFPPEVIIEALNILSAFIEDGERKFENLKRSIKLKNGEIWSHDTDEEFLLIIESHLNKPLSASGLVGLDFIFIHLYLDEIRKLRSGHLRDTKLRPHSRFLKRMLKGVSSNHFLRNLSLSPLYSLDMGEANSGGI